MFLSSPPATAFNPQMNSVGFGSRRHNSIFAAPISAAACIYYQSGLLASPESESGPLWRRNRCYRLYALALASIIKPTQYREAA